MAESSIVCELCGRLMPQHSSYVVRIDVFADPSIPPLEGKDVEAADFDREMQKLIDEMRDFTAEDLQDQVHRRFEYRICRPCQFQFMANPLGLPRQSNVGGN